MNLFDLKNQIALAMLAYDEALTKVADGLTDAEVGTLADEMRREAAEKGMDEYARIAEHYYAEVGTRIIIRRAQVHEERTGESFYCVQCNGTCTPEHLAEFETPIVGTVE